MHEDENVAVFANLYGCDLEEGDVTDGVGRVFQIETSVWVKHSRQRRRKDTMYQLGDFDLPLHFPTLLQFKPVWKRNELTGLGIKNVKDMSMGLEYEHHWYDYVVNHNLASKSISKKEVDVH